MARESDVAAEIKGCRDDLHELQGHEEQMWCQRSVSTWINEGDRNTHFFHCVTNRRKRGNTIVEILGESGEEFLAIRLVYPLFHILCLYSKALLLVIHI